MKKILSFLISLSVAASLTFCAQADEVQSDETIIVLGHECWVEDGNYYTEVDGEKCQVIVLENYIKPESFRNIQSRMNEKVEYDVDLSDGTKYEGRINITQGDDKTPRFYRKNDRGICSFEMSTGFILNTQYNVSVTYEFCDNNGYYIQGSQEHEKITFNLVINTHRFIAGTLTDMNCVCQVTFHQEGSSETERDFRYGMRAII